MTWRTLGWDPATGILERFQYDSLTGETLIHSVQPDCTPELEASKALARAPEHWRQGVKKGMAHYAHVPNGVLLQWRKMGVNISDNKELIKMCNKPEWAYLRCTDKIHS